MTTTNKSLFSSLLVEKMGEGLVGTEEILNLLEVTDPKPTLNCTCGWKGGDKEREQFLTNLFRAADAMRIHRTVITYWLFKQCDWFDQFDRPHGCEHWLTWRGVLQAFHSAIADTHG